MATAHSVAQILVKNLTFPQFCSKMAKKEWGKSTPFFYISAVRLFFGGKEHSSQKSL